MSKIVPKKNELTEQEIESVKQDFDRLKSAITVAAPFISSLLRRLRVTGTKQIETACVDKSGSLRINPDFFKTLDNRDKAWVIGHEVMHIAFRDVNRGKNADQYLFNICCDALNNEIQEGFFRASDNIKAFTATVDKILYEMQNIFKNMTVTPDEVKAMTKEELYHLIYKEMEKKGMCPKGNLKCPKCGSHKIRITNLDLRAGVAHFKCDDCGHTWTEKINLNGGQGGGQSGQSPIPIDSITGLSEIMKDLDKTGDSSKDPNIQQGDPELYNKSDNDEENWKDAVLRAYTAQKLAGRVPAGLQQLIDKMLKAKVNWKDVLRQTCRVGMGKTFITSWIRPHRKIESFPGSHRFTIPRVWCLVDQSGSIYKEETEQFLGEMFDISKNTTLKVISWDADAYEEVEANKPSDVLYKISKRMRGGGGTCIQPVLKKTLARMKPQDIVVVFTDGEIWDIDQDETKTLMHDVAFKAAASVFATTQREHTDKFPKWTHVKVKMDKNNGD